MTDDVRCKRQTLVVSDLHLGGGRFDPGDDHVYQHNELVRFIEQRLATPEGREGQIELFFNGDFLEFAQTHQEAYRSPSTDYWCSEYESWEKLESILAGHFDVFRALRAFQAQGNQVTIAAGNHDVDLWWPRVQRRLRGCVGEALRFEVGVDWVERYDGRLQIAHGHAWDPANRFQRWARPVIDDAPKEPRLEMCPGTLFMVKFVNRLEAEYPFADNLQPVQNLASVLARDDKSGLAVVGWMFLKFAGCYPDALGQSSAGDVGARLLRLIRIDDDFVARVALACATLGESWTAQRVRAQIDTEQRLIDLMMRLLGSIPLAQWTDLFRVPSTPTLGSDAATLGKVLEAKNFGKQSLREHAQQRIDEQPRAQVVVMGHTHIPDEFALTRGVYFNPGSWTRYLDLERDPHVTLERLKDETSFPYELNYICVDAPSSGSRLRATKVRFEPTP